jgi:type IV pilus assembly protein PilB
VVTKDVFVPKFRRKVLPPEAMHDSAGSENATTGHPNLDPIAIIVAGPDDTSITPDGPRLGELLVRRGLLGAGQVAEALIQQSATDTHLGDLLIQLGLLTEEQLAEALAEQAGLELADLSSQELDAEAVRALPESLARSLRAVPLQIGPDFVVIAISDPSPATLQVLRDSCDRPVRPVVTTPATVRRLIDQQYRVLAAVNDHVTAFTTAEALRSAAAGIDRVISHDSDDAPVVQVVNLVLTQAVRDRASDVHIEPQNDRLRIRFRIDGVLHDVLALPAEMGVSLVSRIKIMAGMNIVERRRSQDGQIALELDGRPLDIRVSTTGTIRGEKAVLRLLDKSRPLFRLHDLGMSKASATAFRRLVRSPFGMVICVGPTGSGKTTTLYATLGEINHPGVNVVTIEDPVEYILPSVNQIQVNEAIDITFASTLRATMRQDPDVILVGEIRDADTASIAVRSALTGHLVLSSLHATDAAAAVHRLVDMGVEPFLVSSSVLAVVAQRLVRRICPQCTTTYEPTTDERAFYDQLAGLGQPNFQHGVGCAMCSRTGFHDRIGVYEVLHVDEAMRTLIVEGGTRDQIRDLAVTGGMRTLRQEGIDLVARGVTTISEVTRNIYLL